MAWSVLRERLVKGLWYGMVATAIVALIPVVALALGIWPAPAPISTAFVEALFGVSATSAGAYALAVLGHLAYGAAWGAFLAYVAMPASPLHGVGVGVFRWFVTHWIVVPFIGWGQFGLFLGTSLALVTLVMHLGFGALAGYLLNRDEAGVPLLRPRLPWRASGMLRPT